MIKESKNSRIIISFIFGMCFYTSKILRNFKCENLRKMSIVYGIFINKMFTTGQNMGFPLPTSKHTYLDNLQSLTSLPYKTRNCGTQLIVLR